MLRASCTRKQERAERNTSFKTVVTVFATFGLVCASAASAGEFTFVGSRYQGMGGAGVATVNDSFATYWNPAALATAQSYDAAMNFDMNASVEGDALSIMDNIKDDIDDLDLDDLYDQLRATGTLAANDEDDVEALRDELEKLGQDGIGISGTGSTGLNLRWEQYAVFSRFQADIAIDPFYDDVHTELNDPDVNDDSIVDNDSGARVRGLGVIETGVGYGYSFFDGLVSVGANLKHMRGITYSKYVGYQTIAFQPLCQPASARISISGIRACARKAMHSVSTLA